jgi:hypothetical protein
VVSHSTPSQIKVRISRDYYRFCRYEKVEGLYKMTITPVQRLDNATQSTAVRPDAPPSKVAQPTQDTVHLSSAAVAASLAKPAEATETSAQTIKEALSGDPKAQAILAKK